MHVWALGLSCETPAAPPDRAAGARKRQPENSKRAHFRAPALQNTTKIPREDSQRDTETAKRWREREEKARNFGPPTLRGPTLREPTLRDPTLRGPTLLGSPPFGAPPFLGLGLPPIGAPPFEGPTLVVPKFNIQKLAEIELAEIEIGRSRNWPKSIALAHPPPLLPTKKRFEEAHTPPPKRGSRRK